MRIILTHEHADFDAIGALLGASLLDENALPVLPRQINRNVRAFLNLYGVELPFTEIQDLASEPITSVTLVDTQSLVTIKGMKRNSPVHVIDHHPIRPNLPENWTAHTDVTGACSSIFVEQLSEQNLHLNLIPATLLLIGIYEDTGSLMYAGTTPRDLNAAAYLLEQGASIKIATDYLNQALSPIQRRLYDTLLTQAESLTIQSQNIVITRAETNDFTEEISSIAHKLRDLLDPDALFLLVKTGEGIRLITRSTTDKINVGLISAHFGGGGHDRAATALIQSNDIYPDLNAVYTELVKILPRYIHPSIKVNQIMSQQPMILSPQVSAQEASQLMQRFGYEGYPVISDGKVVGLLTRRAVDRAIAHKLNLPTSSLMEVGDISIQPEDSIERLKQVMSESGWGQIPVVSSENKKIVGIVTRTDLLKTLIGNQTQLPGEHNIGSRLNAALPASRLLLLKKIATEASKNHLAIYIVGGFVRDLLMNRPSLDYDLVVEGDAVILGKSLAKQFGGRIVSHRRFGTAKWWINEIRTQLAKTLDDNGSLLPDDFPESIDLISARTEYYDHPTALPSVERSSIKLDLHRRDFTINTLALRLDGNHYGELYDHWGGLNDLRHGLVRVLHSLSFVDDPTRMLRAVRFEQRFKFRIETRTLQLMDEARTILHHVSGQRLQHEINLILMEEKSGEIFSRMKELGLLSSIQPELDWLVDDTTIFTTILNKQPDPEWNLPGTYSMFSYRQFLGYLIWLSRFPLDKLKEICTKLRLPTKLIKSLLGANSLWNEAFSLVDQPPSKIVSYLEKIPLIAIYAIYLTYPASEVRLMLDKYSREWRNMRPSINGQILRERNIAPGRIYQNILDRIRAAWLDGEIKSIEEENHLLGKLLKDFSDISNYGN